MMSLCSSCGTVVRVVGDVDEIAQLVGDESSFWPNGYVCPKCGGPAVGVPRDREGPELLTGQLGDTLFELIPNDAFALHSGLGLPDERKGANHDVVNAALGEHVTKWSLEVDRMNDRVYIKWLETADGTRLYLGAGPYGAVVFRVRPKQRAADRVNDATGT